MNTYTKMGEGAAVGSNPMTEIVERQKDVDITSLLPPKEVLGIYIQVPFCQTKCTYCNFHTGVASPAAYAPYARAVEREITNWRTFHSAAGIASAAGPALGCHPEFGGPPVVIPNPGRIL